MNIHSVYGLFARYFRPRRAQRLRAILPEIDRSSLKILDAGGSAKWWTETFPGQHDVTVVNIDSRDASQSVAGGIGFVTADGRHLPFIDQAFDLVFSNSVVEHVGGKVEQERFISELKRCGKKVYVQTPNRSFPVEPHLIAPVLHWLPIEFQRHLIRWCSVWGWVVRPTSSEVDSFLRDTHLLSRRDIDALIPGARHFDERFLGLVKSHVVVWTAAENPLPEPPVHASSPTR